MKQWYIDIPVSADQQGLSESREKPTEINPDPVRTQVLELFAAIGAQIDSTGPSRIIFSAPKDFPFMPDLQECFDDLHLGVTIREHTDSAQSSGHA